MKRWRNIQRAKHYRKRRKHLEDMRRNLKPVDAEVLSLDILDIMSKQFKHQHQDTDGEHRP